MNSQPTPSPLGSDTKEGSSLPGALPEAKSALTDTARDAAQKVKFATTEAVDLAKDEASRLVIEKKDATAARIGDCSTAIHESASRLEDKDPNIAWFTHKAADKMQGLADYMRQTDLPSLRTDCENFARRHPAMFFGGLFVAGLVLGNVVKASRRRLEEPGDNSRRADESASQPDNEVDLRTAEREAAGLSQPQP